MSAHATSREELTEKLGVDPARGLEDDEVRRRIAEHGPNRLPAERASLFVRLLRQFSSPIVLTLVAAAIVAAVVGARAPAGGALERYGDAIDRVLRNRGVAGPEANASTTAMFFPSSADTR